MKLMYTQFFGTTEPIPIHIRNGREEWAYIKVSHRPTESFISVQHNIFCMKMKLNFIRFLKTLPVKQDQTHGTR
jgi:hypothetical protein